MRLPNAELAEVSEDKIVRYLLSTTHPAGASKAAFFGKHGFDAQRWELLAQALRKQAVEGEVAVSTQTPYGTRYVIDGFIAAPDGATLKVRSVWFISRGSSVPGFATAHPLRK